MITTDTSIEIRKATEVERQSVLYQMQTEKMVWEDIHPERTRFFIALEAQQMVGFIRYEPGYVNALFDSLYVVPDHEESTVKQGLVERVEEAAMDDRRQQIVCFSKTMGDFLTVLGYDEIVVGEGLRLIGDTPRGRWLKGRQDVLTREICFQKYLM